MKTRWIVQGASVIGALAVLSVASPAFASSGPEGPGVGKEALQQSTLTLSCNTGALANGQPQYVCTVGNIAQTSAKTTMFFRALNSQEAGAFGQNSYGRAGGHNRSHDDSGTILNGLKGVAINPTAAQQHFKSTSETFTISGALPSNTVALTVGQYSQDRTNEDADEGVVKLTPPVGQLPEVPFAVGLPIAGLGVGMLMWRRARRNPV